MDIFFLNRLVLVLILSIISSLIFIINILDFIGINLYRYIRLFYHRYYQLWIFLLYTK
jgi:hypothetical protein